MKRSPTAALLGFPPSVLEGLTEAQAQLDGLLALLGDVYQTAEDVRLGGRRAPLLDILETPEGYVVEMEAPGVPAEALSVTFQHGALIIKGRWPDLCPATQCRYHQMERRTGSFTRVIKFPDPLDPTRTTARLGRGLLTVALPRLVPPGRQPAEIPVQVVPDAGEPEKGPCHA